MPDLEAAVICLPNALHAGAAVAALRHGKHVYLEKPLATNLNEAQSVLQAWRNTSLVGMIGFNLRFNALYQDARMYIQETKIGELVATRSVLSTSAGLPKWKRTRRSGGGALLDLASHHIDLVRFLFGQEVREVSVELRSQASEEDSAMLRLRLANGLPVQSFFSLNSVDEDRFEIYGQAGKLAVDRYQSLNVEIIDSAADFSRLKWLKRGLKMLVRGSYVREKIGSPSREPSYRLALAHFVAACRGNRPGRPNFWDGYHALLVVEAAAESAGTDRTVLVEEIAGEDLTGQ